MYTYMYTYVCFVCVYIHLYIHTPYIYVKIKGLNPVQNKFKNCSDEDMF